MTPQEKKRLSYERDRRNTYGENDKSSRRNIPRGKRLASRRNRRSVSVALVDVRGSVEALGHASTSAEPNPVEFDDGPADFDGPADKVGPRIAGRRPARFRKWRDEPLAEVVAYQLGRRARDDRAGAAIADARLRRPEQRAGRRLGADGRDLAYWLRGLAMIDKQIRLRDGDRRRRWVRERMAEVGRAELSGALTPNDVALQNTRFVAGLHRDRILTEVADLVPTADELVRECLVRMPVSQREMRAGRPVDAHRIRDARRLVIAAGALAPYVLDPGLAGELRTWRRLRHAR